VTSSLVINVVPVVPITHFLLTAQSSDKWVGPSLQLGTPIPGRMVI